MSASFPSKVGGAAAATGAALWSACALAQSIPTTPASESPESMLGTLVRTVLVLGVVLALIYVVLNYGLRKMMGVRALPLGGGGVVKVVERIPLDPKRSLFVVQAAGEYLLLGSSEETLGLISRLDRAAVDALLQARAQQPQTALSPFLQRLLSKKGAPPPGQV